MKVTRKILIDEIAENTGISKPKVKEVLECFSGLIITHLTKRDTMEIDGIGIFKTSKTSARTGRNPVTKEPLEIPARMAPKFKFAKWIKDAVAEMEVIDD